MKTQTLAMLAVAALALAGVLALGLWLRGQSAESPASEAPDVAAETETASGGTPQALIPGDAPYQPVPIDPDAARPGEGEMEEPVKPPGTVPPEMREEPAVAAAIAQAAARAGLEESEVVVTRVEEVTWPDASLGCPQSGMAYIQVLTPGYRVVTFAGGERIEWHTDDGSRGAPQVVTCSEGTPGRVDAASPRALEAVMAALAAKLGLDPDAGEIDLVASTPIAGNAPRCAAEPLPPGPGSERPAVMEYELRHGDTVYAYRTDGERIEICREQQVDEAGNAVD